MRASATILAFLFVTGAAAAQETSETSKADYSKDSIMRVLRAQAEEDQKKANVSFHVGAVTFNAIGTRWRFNYLPIMAPLAGTRLTTSREWPDAFSLTGVPLATPKRAWRTQRQVDSEMKRITDTEKKKVKIRINAQ